MPLQPSRRDLLVGGAGAVVGLAGGVLGPSVVGRIDGTATDGSTFAPLAWAETEWPFPDYDAARTRHPSAGSAPDDDLERRWEFRDATVYGETWAPPVVANGRVFTAAAEERGTTVWALDAGDGDVDWRHRYVGDGGTDPALAAPGDGVYYRIAGGESPLGLYAAADGERAWGASDPPRGGWTLGDGRLYYGDRTSGSLVAYDARTGEKLWTTSVDDERLVVRSSHPEFGLFASALGTLYALDPADGAVLWDVPVPKHTKTGPVVAGGRAFVTKWMDGMALLALDAESGEERWRYPLAPTEVTEGERTYRRYYDLGAATPETVVVRERRADPTPGALHAVEAADGQRRWRVRPTGGASYFSEPTVIDGDVYVGAGGAGRSELLRYDLADGSLTGSWPLARPPVAALVTDGRVLVTTADGMLAFA